MMGFLRNIFGGKDKLKKLTPKDLTSETGLRGDADTVYTLAQTSTPYEAKIAFVQGCQQAFSAGRPQNLRAFLAGYLEFKRGNGLLTDILNGKKSIDDGLDALAIKPAMLIAEKSADAKACLENLSVDLSPFYKTAFLDMVLRIAAVEGSWTVVEAALALGADPNTGHGRPLYNAFTNKHDKIAGILFDHGAEIEKITSKELSPEQRQALTELYNKLTGKHAAIHAEAAQQDIPPPPPPAKDNPPGFRL